MSMRLAGMPQEEPGSRQRVVQREKKPREQGGWDSRGSKTAKEGKAQIKNEAPKLSTQLMQRAKKETAESAALGGGREIPRRRKGGGPRKVLVKKGGEGLQHEETSLAEGGM